MEAKAEAKALRLALVGAESTGKSWLARDLAAHFQARGWRATAVGEALREWCDREGRVPRQDEQMAIAIEQAWQVDQAAAAADVVIADTTPLMTAIYSDLLFADRSIYPFALEHQRSYDLTLLTGLDIAWVADGLQRDGPHVREPVDTKVRAALEAAGIAYKVIYGIGPARLKNALYATRSIANQDRYTRASGRFGYENEQEYALTCQNCGDPRCERRLFSDLLEKRPPGRR